MARGPKKHLKRLNAPRNWMLSKLGGIFAPRPSTGPHKFRESIPLIILLRNRLKLALTRREVIMIAMSRAIKVDGKIRTDTNFPCGFMDVMSIEKSNQHYRILYDTTGRFVLHRIADKEAEYKLCRVKSVSLSGKAAQGSNPFEQGIRASIPVLVTNDGRTIRYPDPLIKANDTVQVDLKTGKIMNFMKFEPGMMAMITAGHNIGRVGVITARDVHLGSFDIVHMRDKNGQEFSTRMQNVFVIGNETTSAVTLPKGNGLKYSIIEQKEQKEKKAKKSHK